MISKDMIEFLEKFYKVDAKKLEFNVMFQDITDEQMKQAIFDGDPKRDFWDIVEYLIQRTDNKETEAHLLGLNSHDHRQEEIRITEELMERLDEQRNSNRQTY